MIPLAWEVEGVRQGQFTHRPSGGHPHPTPTLCRLPAIPLLLGGREAGRGYPLLIPNPLPQLSLDLENSLEWEKEWRLRPEPGRTGGQDG